MTNYDILKEYEANKTPVPSYEEWQSMDRLEKIMLQERARLNKQVIELLEENTKLKELLKECKEMSFEIRLALSSGKINDVFTLTYKIENKIDQALGEDK